ncbi:MAG: hypothetical protein H6553_06665 [Chitinophagales bacterium]|nr:hypothetical protein [Chitinophagales bacterium]
MTKQNQKYIKIGLLLALLGIIIYLMLLPFKKRNKEKTGEQQFLIDEADKAKEGEFKTVGTQFGISEKDAQNCNQVAYKLNDSLYQWNVLGIGIQWNWIGDDDDITIAQLNRIKTLKALQCVNYYFKIHRKNNNANVAQEVKEHLGTKVSTKNFSSDMVSWLNIISKQAS